MDEDVSSQVANALMEPYEHSNWEKHSSFFPQRAGIGAKNS